MKNKLFHINYNSPICLTGYGIVSLNILKELYKIDNNIIELKRCIENKDGMDKLMENIDLLECFLIKYGYLIDKDDITRLMREVKKTYTPNKYDYF